MTQSLNEHSATTRGIQMAPFGAMPDGTRVDRYTLSNAAGIQIAVLSYGGIIQSIIVPDRAGAFTNVALGHDSLDGYRHDRSHLGSLIGRYANRIRGGRFTLDGREFSLARNQGTDHLHGGVRGFDTHVWAVTPFERADEIGLVLAHVSPDGDEGYPGRVSVRVTYTLTDRGELIVDYLATTDAATPINLTQHSYFNLAGEGAGSIVGHELMLAASRFTPTDDTQLPTGELRDVDATPLDFRTPHVIGARIDADDEQLRLAHGYDHNFVIDRASDDELVLAARLTDPSSGRGVDVYTTEPGIQFYSGNHLDGQDQADGSRSYSFRAGLALETQRFPDSPNQPDFPSSILRPGDEYRSRTIYHFVVRTS